MDVVLTQILKIQQTSFMHMTLQLAKLSRSHTSISQHRHPILMPHQVFKVKSMTAFKFVEEAPNLP